MYPQTMPAKLIPHIKSELIKKKKTIQHYISGFFGAMYICFYSRSAFSIYQVLAISIDDFRSILVGSGKATFLILLNIQHEIEITF